MLAGKVVLRLETLARNLSGQDLFFSQLLEITSFRMQLSESEVRPHQKSTGIKSFHQSQCIVIVYSLNRSIFL